MTDKLAILSHIERRLAAIETVDEAKGIRDQARALEVYFQSAQKGLAVQNRAAAIKIAAECRAGQLLQAIERSSGGRGKTGSSLSRVYADTGISAGTGKRWQAMAAFSADRIRDLEARQTARGEELTSTLLRQLARSSNGHGRPEPRSGIEIHRCDFRALLPTLEGLDAIMTDVPYDKEFVQVCAEFARLAKPALGPGGVLAVMVGHVHHREILWRMGEHIQHRGTISYLCPGPAPRIWARKVAPAWKPVLLFGETGDDCDWIFGCVVRSDGPDKRFHEWGQSESGMARLVEMLTKPGDLICDPFAGGGTLGVVCARLGRRCILGDVNAPDR